MNLKHINMAEGRYHAKNHRIERFGSFADYMNNHGRKLRSKTYSFSESMVVTDPQILSQFKYRLTGKKKEKLMAKFAVISGHVLEHYLRHGKPPFMNFGLKRNCRWCRY